MAPVVLRYALDPTGLSPDNLVSGDLQTMPNRLVRAVAPTYGAFFSKSLVIVDQATNQPLTADQYYAAEMYEQPTREFGQEICSIVMITDTTVSSNISLSYQALGGEYSAAQTAIINQLYNLNLDDRPVSWPNIVAKPDAFPPSPHLHDAGDLYGFEYVVQAIDRMRAAILMGDTAANDAILRYVDAAIAKVQAEIDQGDQALDNHLADYGNPHKVTAAQTGAYTTAQTDSKDATVAQNAATANNTTNSNLNAHTSNFSNPHKVTPAQLNVYTEPQVDSMFATTNANISNHIANKSNPHAVTAAQVGAYTVAQSQSGDNTVQNNLNSHTSNVSNPHQTTAAQVGAWDSGTSAAYYNNSVNYTTGHIQNQSNPHNTTAAQVGLGNVSNYPIGSDQDFITGQNAGVYLTARALQIFHDNYMTVSGGTPSGGAREGHIWYQVQ